MGQLRCDTCPFWAPPKALKVANVTAGTCRAEPPKVMLLPGPLEGALQLQTIFPAIPADAWCGRHPAFKDQNDGT